MCWEDVKIGRNKVAKSLGTQTVAGGTPAQLCAGNASRAALIVSLRPSDVLSTSDAVRIVADGALGANLHYLTAENPTVRLDVEQYGQAVLGPVWAFSDSVGGVLLLVSELVWNKEPGNQ